MVLTTAGPPPTGINWQAVITAYLSLLTEPGIGMATTPTAKLNVAALPSIGMQPPVLLNLLTEPMITAEAGSKEGTAFRVEITPSIGVGSVPTAVLNLSATPSVGFTGAPIDTGILQLTITPSIGLTATKGITYDATGSALTTGTGTAFTWNHTIGGNAIIAAALIDMHTITAPTVTAKVGTTAMTQLAYAQNYGNSGSGFYASLVVFGLLNPPTGAQTITLTTSASTNVLIANSLSYGNVGSFGTAITNTGMGTTASVSASIAAKHGAVAVFGTWAETLSGFTGLTDTYNVTYNTLGFAMGDASAAESSMSANLAASNYWGAILVPLNT